MVKHYRELVVWQKAVGLVVEIYRVTAHYGQDERYGLVSQLRRAAVSIPSNIAEGQGRATTGEFLQFLGHARGSLFGVETQLIISRKLGLLPAEQFDALSAKVEDVARLLSGLIRSLSKPSEKTGSSV